MFVTGRDVTFGKYQPPQTLTKQPGKIKAAKNLKNLPPGMSCGVWTAVPENKLKTPPSFISLTLEVAQLLGTELNPFPFKN